MKIHVKGCQLLTEGHEQEGEVLEKKIQNDGDLITVVMDYRDELVNLKISLEEQEASRDNNSPISSLDQTLVPLTAKVQQILNGQQQLQHQQLTNMQSNDIDVAVWCSNEIHAGQCLGGGPGMENDQCRGKDPTLKYDLCPGKEKIPISRKRFHKKPFIVAYLRFSLTKQHKRYVSRKQ